MKITTSVALLCLASLASAQTKVPMQKAPGVPGYFPPPAGVSFLVAGGSDDCANAMANDTIVGNGTFAVTTTGAITGVSPQTTSTIKNDVWFYWQAPVTGNATLSTCAGVTADSKIAAWADNNGGACPSGTSLAYNDDNCALQSSISFPVTAGLFYFLQIGAYAEGTTFSGTFDISAFAPPPLSGSDNCATASAFVGPSAQGFDLSAATTGAEGQAEAICLFFTFTSIINDNWWSYTATATGTATIQTCAMLTSGTDTKIAIYNGAGCPTGPAIACVDDSCALMTSVTFPIVCGQTYAIQIGGYAYTVPQVLVGSFTLTETGGACNTPPVPYCFGDGSGAACPCANNGVAGNGCASSVNANGANLTSTGNASVASDTLVLQGTGMPNSSALYFQGTTQIGVAFGDGLRCVGGTVIRLGTKSNVAGASSYPVGADQVISIRGMNAPASVRNYQVWYRNAAAFCNPETFNLSNGLNVTWGA